jgi:hypothetical protein
MLGERIRAERPCRALYGVGQEGSVVSDVLRAVDEEGWRASDAQPRSAHHIVAKLRGVALRADDGGDAIGVEAQHRRHDNSCIGIAADVIGGPRCAPAASPGVKAKFAADEQQVSAPSGLHTTSGPRSRSISSATS